VADRPFSFAKQNKTATGLYKFGLLFYYISFIAGWSSPVARQAHNLKATGSNPVPATKSHKALRHFKLF
jgi:hypothetical protein